MGIPAAFRWLSSRYPKIISPVIEDQPITMEDGTVIPVDTTRPNPNGEEFDNLYLDMNGIVHPCSHPEDRPAPADEEEMMLEVFRYTDRVVNMVRPRKILMIAVDGVAPRAKMNQQRSRRFRSAQEAEEKERDKQELIKMLKQQNGGNLPAESAESVVKKAFDSNSITPGTPFMDILALSLRYWCQYKHNTDPGWAKLKVIISDATVPGEGEHKIMDFVRSQRASPDHDPNTRHVIYGLDADLIMLGLATHEPHFRVLREDVFFQQGKARTCQLCGQKGHEARNCRGEANEKDGKHDEKDSELALKPFIWLHVAVLREYLGVELSIPGLPFRFDLERAIDDWIFMCCFVGNDFLPHLPALEIREDGINTLTAIWRDNLPVMGGYVTKDGHIDMERAQVILDGLAKQEDAIFKRRKEQEDRREANAKRRKLQNESNGKNGPPSWNKKPQYVDHTAGQSLQPIGSFSNKPSQTLSYDMIVSRSAVQDANVANKSAASVLKDRLRAEKTAPAADTEHDVQSSPSALGKRKASDLEEGDAAKTSVPTPAPAVEEESTDSVRMWEEGYADRYYEQKFNKDPTDLDFRRQVAHAYAEGLQWVLLYYFQGCPSWDWYYPYHYAPFAGDFKELSSLKISFEKGYTSRPFEQLMSVLPAASRHALPEVFHPLMLDGDSPIIDFYPEDFEIDLNGKKFAWQGVALLPFIDMPRLLAAVQSKYPLLSPENAARNVVGKVDLLLSDGHEGIYDEILTNFYSKKQGAPQFKLNPKTSGGLSGKVVKQDDYVPHGMLQYPLERKTMPDLEYDRSVRYVLDDVRKGDLDNTNNYIRVHYEMPVSTHTHKSMLLRGAKLPAPTLNRSDIEIMKGQARRGGRSYGGAPLGRFDHNSGWQEKMTYGPDQRGGYGGRGGYRGGHRGGSRGGSRGGGGNSHNGDRGGYGGGYGRSGPSAGYGQYAGAPPQGWQPPPPGGPGFGMGAPPAPGTPGFGMVGVPPPPPVHYQNGQHGGHQQGGYQQGYGSVPASQSYHGHRGPGGQSPYLPHGQQQNRHNGQGGGYRDGNYR